MVRASLCGVLYLLYRTPGGKSTSKSALLYTRRGWAQFRRAVQRRQGFRRALAGRKEGEDRTFCKKPAIGSAPKGGSKGRRRRPSREKEPVYKIAPKDNTKQRLFLRALRPATQLHRRDGPANAPTLLGERKEYAGKGTGKTILYTGLHTGAQEEKAERETDILDKLSTELHQYPRKIDETVQ